MNPTSLTLHVVGSASLGLKREEIKAIQALLTVCTIVLFTASLIKTLIPAQTFCQERTPNLTVCGILDYPEPLSRIVTNPQLLGYGLKARLTTTAKPLNPQWQQWTSINRLAEPASLASALLRCVEPEGSKKHYSPQSPKP